MSTTTPAPEAAEQTPPEGSPDGNAPVETPTAPKFDDVIGGLDEAAREVILARITKPNSEARQLRERLKELEPKAAEFERQQEAAKSDLQKAQEAAEQANATIQALRTQAVTSKIEALAATTFHDATDAHQIGTDFLSDDGTVNEEAIKAALGDLISRKPHLARTNDLRAPLPNPAQGASAAGQPTEAERAAQAAAQGNWDASLALKADQLLHLRDKTH